VFNHNVQGGLCELYQEDCEYAPATNTWSFLPYKAPTTPLVAALKSSWTTTLWPGNMVLTVLPDGEI